jgi:DHA1 family bicyclomycin/chloramphenicol resistance-like MFS transporter
MSIYLPTAPEPNFKSVDVRSPGQEARRLQIQIPSRLFALCLASISLIGPLSVHLFLPVIPAIRTALGLSHAIAQLTFTVSLFVMAFATLAYGSLSDRYGRRPVLLSGLGLFLFGSCISAFSNDVFLIVLGRMVQAAGAGCGVTLVRAIARDAYGPEQLIKAIAYLTMFYTLGPMLSPVVGGILVDAFGWRSSFLFALVIGSVVAVGAYLVIYETHPPRDFSLSKSNVFRDFGNLFSNLRFSAFVLQSGFSTGAFITLASGSSTLMKEFLNRPALEFGAYFVLFPAGFLCGNFITTRLGNRVVTEKMVLIGSILLIFTISIQSALLISGYINPLTIFMPGFFVTLAQGISLPYAQAGAMGTIPHLAGTASGVGVFCQHFCGAFFAQLFGVFSNGTARPMAVTALLSAFLCLFAGVIPFVLLRRGRSAVSL